MAQNIVPTAQSSMTWDPQKAREQVNAICDLVQKKVEATAGWYVKKKVAPSWVSRILRAAAILLSVVGGLCPIIQSALGADAKVFDITLNNWGYILLALAAAAVLIDRYGGFSTTWMRFIGTHLKLDAKLHQFQIEWVIACAQYDLDPAKKPEKLIALMERLERFVDECSGLVEEETQLWMSEFQSQLAMLQKATEKQQKAITGEAAAEEEMGEVSVTVSNYDEAKSSVHLLLDEAPMIQLSAKNGTLRRVRSGTHVISAHTLADGKLVKADGTAVVTAGGKTDLALTLPLDDGDSDNMVNPST